MAPDLLRSFIRSTALGLVRLGLLSLAEFSAGQGLGEIKAEYRETLYQAMADYLGSEQSITSFRNIYRRAVNDGMTLSFIAGFADAGGASEELPEEDRAWLIGRIEDEIAFADGLFQELKSLRADNEKSQDDKLAFAQARANGYTSSLDGVYAQGKMRGDQEQIGVWHFGDTDHCDTCRWLNDQEHPLSWYISNGYIPQEAGSGTLDCGGYHCQCTIDTPDGEQLIP